MPRLRSVPEVKRHGDWFLLDTRGEMLDVPPEVYLREFRDTPAGDVDALADLCSLGMIRTLNTAAPYDDLPIWTSDQWARALAEVSTMHLPEGVIWDGDEGAREEVRKDRVSYFPIHSVEVALRVRAVQRATDHLIAYRNGDPVENAWRDCEDEVEAWRLFTSFTGEALKDFHVRVEIPTPHEPPEEFTIGGVYPTLYGVAMLQLVNDLAAEVPYLRCANTTCGRMFARQRGRTEYGGHRMSGVRYCSNSCARAQYQREKRQRDRVNRRA